ncbi:MAG: GrrA/OscA1 family cyclophane-containing rSAM-modified RiPP [Gemmataceae bacterium]
MSHPSRRQLLAGFLTGLAQVSGAIVVARATLADAATEGNQAPTQPARDNLQERADKIAADEPLADEERHEVAFVNGAFRNGGGGGFRNGAFANGGGGFHNGGFANGGGGGFHNGGFANGGGGGGGAFRNGGFANGGGGGGFRNGAFRNY